MVAVYVLTAARCAGRVHPALWALTASPSGGHCSCLPACLEAPAPDAPACAACDSCVASFAHAASCAAHQVHTYLQRYARVATLPTAALDSLQRAHVTLAEALSPHAHARQALAYLDEAAAIARGQWTQFRPAAIAAGLVVLGATAALCLALLPVLLRYRGALFAHTTALSRAFHLRPAGPAVAAASRSLGGAAALAFLLATLRAAIPFSNSLVLGELQAVTLLAASVTLVAGGGALSRSLAVHRAVAAAYYALPPHTSPKTALQRAWALLAAALPLRARRRRAPQSAAGGAFEEPVAAPLRGKRFRRAPTLVAVACLLAATLLPNPVVRVQAMAACGGAAAALLRLQWAFVDPARTAPSATREPLTLQATIRAALLIAATAAAALGACYGLSHFGGIDRIGANPFDKAAAPAAAPATRPPPWAVALPALVATSVLAAQLDTAARRIVRTPATVQRFGMHVPFWKALGDALLYVKSLGGLFAWLLPDRRMLLWLLELDTLDDEGQTHEAQLYHTPPGVRLLCRPLAALCWRRLSFFPSARPPNGPDAAQSHDTRRCDMRSGALTDAPCHCSRRRRLRAPSQPRRTSGGCASCSAASSCAASRSTGSRAAARSACAPCSSSRAQRPCTRCLPRLHASGCCGRTARSPRAARGRRRWGRCRCGSSGGCTCLRMRWCCGGYRWRRCWAT